MATEYVITEKQNLVNIADEIRNITGSTDTMKIDEMPNHIVKIRDMGNRDIENGLISRTITEYSNDSITSIGDYAFYYCSKLTAIDVPVVTSIGINAFEYCKALTAIDLPAATSIGSYAFNSCTALTAIDVPVATSIDSNAFKACNSLTAIELPVVNSIGNYAFQYCVGLTAIDAPVTTSIGNYAFYACNKLTAIDLPVVTSIGNNAFQSCNVLTTVILRNANSVCTLKNTNAFTSTKIASGTGYIYVPSDLLSTYQAATNWATYSAQFRALEDYTVDGTTTGALDESKI